MRWRLTLGPLLVLGLAAVFYWDAHLGPSAPVLFTFTLLLALRASWELVRLMRIRSFEPQYWLVAGGSVAVLVANWWERFAHPNEDLHVRSVGALGPAMIAASVVFLLLLLSEAIRYRKPGKSMETLGAELIIVVYVGVLLSVAAQLRWVAGHDAGYFSLGSLVVAAKFGDTFALFLGKYWGGRKLAEHLSPGKTWVGAWAALLGGCFGSVLWFHWIAPWFNPEWPRCTWPAELAFGLAIGIVGLVGDLCESLIKRDLGHKDSAKLLPGFGGLLDVLDSVVYAAPVAYLLWLVLPLGP
jgi:phosphatidate cytidylyltransferase